MRRLSGLRGINTAIHGAVALGDRTRDRLFCPLSTRAPGTRGRAPCNRTSPCCAREPLDPRPWDTCSQIAEAPLEGKNSRGRDRARLQRCPASAGARPPIRRSRPASAAPPRARKPAQRVRADPSNPPGKLAGACRALGCEGPYRITRLTIEECRRITVGRLKCADRITWTNGTRSSRTRMSAPVIVRSRSPK
jgi:hypothetical protein